MVLGNQDSQWGILAGVLYGIKGACALHSVFGLLVVDSVNKELLYLDRLQTALLNTISNIGDEDGIAALDIALGAKVIRHAGDLPQDIGTSLLDGVPPRETGHHQLKSLPART